MEQSGMLNKLIVINCNFFSKGSFCHSSRKKSKDNNFFMAPMNIEKSWESMISIKPLLPFIGYHGNC